MHACTYVYSETHTSKGFKHSFQHDLIDIGMKVPDIEFLGSFGLLQILGISSSSSKIKCNAVHTYTSIICVCAYL